MSDVDVCLHCQITDALDRSEEEKADRRAEMTAFGRYVDERIESAYREAEGRLLHRTLFGDYLAPAGSPNAHVGFVRQPLCLCGRRA